MTPEKLVELAIEAMHKAYAPYSGFKVGAALLCADGTVYLVFDGNRFGERREMYFVRFTVDDVLAGRPVSGVFRLIKLHEKYVFMEPLLSTDE